ncbi:hypothetical protein ElyMa_003788300 [Elysia marginata]|uniref:Secreted protein n=1 Tax=Elysia marginata TaxID=1093978 RepID=A0AAV4FDS6_9GAST|nr:hypothetical protein ElyMa_003788300 [Elysia marginata]
MCRVFSLCYLVFISASRWKKLQEAKCIAVSSRCFLPTDIDRRLQTQTDCKYRHRREGQPGIDEANHYSPGLFAKVDGHRSERALRALRQEYRKIVVK